MAKFCEICENLLLPNFSENKINFICNICHISYASDSVDTLRRERVKESDINIFSKILNKANDDPCTIKARIKCKNDKCVSDVVKQVRVGQDLKLYNICTVCNLQWLN
jgi:DNA-directed RNA polymerase subunit M/transcription elongation factor TFIIS